MSTFTYYPPFKKVSEIDQKTLQHRYFAQLAPDGIHLVPGMLQQGERPAIGNWLDVANITRDFPRRYFVQYTDFNTLVPGSLIQGDRYPAGQWKEVKKASIGAFHRAVFSIDGVYMVDKNITVESTFAESYEFTTDKIIPVLDQIQPGINVEENPVNFQLFYFAGNFDELDEDPIKLVPFASPGAYFSLFFTVPGGDYSAYLSTSQGLQGIADFRVQPSTLDGIYSIILGALTYDPQLETDVVSYYIVLENIVNKTELPTD